MTRRLTVEVGILLVLACVFVWSVPASVARRDSGYQFVGPLVDVHSEVMRHYVESPDDQEMLTGALRGMLDTLDDPYTVYFDPSQHKIFEKQTSGEFTGIGALIGREGNHITIVTPLEDSPAFEAGIIAGDTILAIDGQDAEVDPDTPNEIAQQQAVDRISGPEGTQVMLTIRHTDEKVEDITITRRRIQIRTVKGFARNGDGHWNYMLDPKRGIGYVRMTQFTPSSAAALRAALEELNQQDMTGLILDLRYNPGGLLESAVQVADLFLDDGPIVSTKGRNRNEEVHKAKDSNTLEPFPMVVLVNQLSASASEIVAGALKDNDRAVVLGMRTFGKGSVQQVMELEDGRGAIKLTTAHYYLPSGRNIHRRPDVMTWGVDPSDGFCVPMSDEQMKEMIRIRRENEIIRADNGQSSRPDEMAADWITTELADAQLAGAFETLAAHLDTGEFVPVGKSAADAEAYFDQRQRLLRSRDALRNRLEEVETRLQQIEDKFSGEEQPTEASAKDEDAETEPAAEPAVAE